MKDQRDSRIWVVDQAGDADPSTHATDQKEAMGIAMGAKACTGAPGTPSTIWRGFRWVGAWRICVSRWPQASAYQKRPGSAGGIPRKTPQLTAPSLKMRSQETGWISDRAGVLRDAAQRGAVTPILRFVNVLNPTVDSHMLWLDGSSPSMSPPASTAAPLRSLEVGDPLQALVPNALGRWYWGTAGAHVTGMLLGMTKDLFRAEVREARKSDWLGATHLPGVRLGWPVSILAAALVLAVVIALFFGGYARKERVPGQLVPAGGLLNVTATASGVITRRLVREGELVHAGQPLMELSPDIDVVDSQAAGAVAERIAVELDRRQDRLREDLDNLEAGRRQQEAALRRQILGLKRQLESIEAELVVRHQQAESSERMLERIRPLWDQRTLSDVQAQQYEDQALNARAALEVATRNRLDIEHGLADAQLQLEELPLTLAARRSDIEGALADIEQTRVRNMAQRAILLKAPGAGVVSGLAIEQGQAVVERQRLLSLVPEGARLQGELWAPTHAIGLVEVGDLVAIRYHAFPHQKFGHQRGRVVEIGGSPLSPDEVRSRSGLDPGQPAFRILVELDRQRIAAGTGEHALRAGMSLDADLIQEYRRLYEWLIAPMGDVLRRTPDGEAP